MAVRIDPMRASANVGAVAYSGQIDAHLRVVEARIAQAQLEAAAIAAAAAYDLAWQALGIHPVLQAFPGLGAAQPVVPGLHPVQRLAAEIFGLQIGGQGIGGQRVAPLLEQAGRGRHLADRAVGLQEHGVADDGLRPRRRLHPETIGRDEVHAAAYRLRRAQHLQFGVEAAQGRETLAGAQHRLRRIGDGYRGLGAGRRRRAITGGQQQAGQQGQGRQPAHRAFHGGGADHDSPNVPHKTRDSDIIGGMDRYERITALHRLLKSARYPVTVATLQDKLGCSRATVYRDLAFLRDALMAPIEGDGEAGFRYQADESDRFELPGLWLSSEELHALLASQHLLARTGGGVLSSVLAPLQQRIESLLAAQAGVSSWPVDRVRVIPHRGRKFDEGSFRSVASAVLERRQLAFEYRARSTDEPTKRTVSPQRLTHYRDNWYLDAWDHDRDALRSFAVDRIHKARVVDSTARDVADSELDEQLGASYGIFSGAPKGWATILFSAKAARWVADEHWHSKQQGRFLADGRYELKVPYSVSRELLMDVLHYGSDAEIVEPMMLREQAKALLELALSNYENS